MASAISLRLSVPASSSWSGDLASGYSTSTSGYYLRGIFGLFGIGYASNELTVSGPSSTAKHGSTAIDFSIDPIDFLSLGYGTVIGGSYSNSTTSGIELDSASGSTTFLDLNFGIGPIDLLVGYRMWDVTHSLKWSTYNLNIDSKGKWSEMTVGVGVGF